MSQLSDPASWSSGAGLPEIMAQLQQRCAVLENRQHRVEEAAHQFYVRATADFLGVTTQEVAKVFTTEELESFLLR